MRFYVPFIILILLHSKLYAQDNITSIPVRPNCIIHVMDTDTKLPVRDAIITNSKGGWTTDKYGKAEVNINNAGKEVNISILGYETQLLHTQAGVHNYQVALKRIYHTMSNVEIKAGKLRIDSLIRLAAERVPQNYPQSNIALDAAIELYLLRSTDTILQVSKQLEMYNKKKNTWLEYNIYSHASDNLFFIVDKATYSEVKNYVVHTIFLPEKPFAEGLFYVADNITKYTVVLSTFTEGGDKYYDIVLMSADDSKTKYPLLARLMGYGGDNNPNSYKKYVSVSEIILNSRNMALVFHQNINVEAGEKAREELLKLTNRNDIRDWLTNAFATNKDYTQLSVSFVPYSQDTTKWQPYRSYYFDNFMHVLYKGDSIGDYTYVQEFTYTPRGININEPIVPVNPWTEVYEYYKPPEDKKKRRR